MTSLTFSEKRWNIIAVIVVIFLILFTLTFSGGLDAILGSESYSTLYLYKLNGSVIPQRNIISLTDEDFKVFPKMATVIRDETQKPGDISENGERLYTIPLTSDEYYIFSAKYLPYYPGDMSYGRFLEYKGKFYRYTPPPIH
jgi:hypothetical protein